MRRNSRLGDAELVRDQLVRLAERGELHDIALARAERTRIGTAVLVAPRDDVAATAALEVIDERPLTADQRGPHLRRALWIFAARFAARFLLAQHGIAQRLASGRRF